MREIFQNEDLLSGLLIFMILAGLSGHYKLPSSLRLDVPINNLLIKNSELQVCLIL